jgi:sigma-B regulation protein RsbU (phosphoserine phosphatase)
MEALIVRATLDSLGSIREYVTQAAAAAGLGKKAAYRLCLAVDEIASNAIVHGHAGADGKGVLQVRADIDEKSLTITLEDTGEPYDPRQTPPPDDLEASLEDRQTGGLGIYLTLKGVDEFRYERVVDWNRNIFVMNRAMTAAENRVYSNKLADDLIHVILPIGIALSGEKNFDRLLERILTQAKSLCNADGGTLYLREDDCLKFAIMLNDSLHIATGGTTGKEVSYPHLQLYDETTGQPNYHNVASYVALCGHSIDVPDIYNAKDFDFSGTRAFDQKNGYRSISTFTAPLKNHDGEVIGVLQLLNAQDPQTGRVIPFDSYMQQLVEALASQAAVVLNNRMLLERQKELLRYEHELQIGQQIQASFLPNELPQPSGWEIGADFYPAREVAGDFYDAFYLEGGRKVCLVIADVCDKGVGAALFMALTRSLIRAFAELDKGGEMGLKSPVELTNEYVLRNHLQANMFVTLFYGVLDPATGLLTYVNSGHNPPLIIGSTGVKARLRPTGPAVGMFPGAEFKVDQVSLEPGDVLFAFTDGVTEARNSNGGFFTEKRLLQLLEQPASSAAALLNRIEESVRAHSDATNRYDDITMLAARRKPVFEAERW